jgi:hypothetical protein
VGVEGGETRSTPAQNRPYRARVLFVFSPYHRRRVASGDKRYGIRGKIRPVAARAFPNKMKSMQGRKVEVVGCVRTRQTMVTGSGVGGVPAILAIG